MQTREGGGGLKYITTITNIAKIANEASDSSKNQNSLRQIREGGSHKYNDNNIYSENSQLKQGIAARITHLYKADKRREVPQR